jgi:hypothetical protein
MILAKNILQKAIVIALVSGNIRTTKDAELTERRAIINNKNLFFFISSLTILLNLTQ